MKKFIERFWETSTYLIERGYSIVFSPITKFFDWAARGWLANEIAEQKQWCIFLETSMAEQRLTISRYINENKSLSERLSKHESTDYNSTKERLESKEEITRLTNLLRHTQNVLRETQINNESLNDINAKMRVAGNQVAESVSINKPKKRFTKKDKELQAAIDNWNKNSQ